MNIKLCNDNIIEQWNKQLEVSKESIAIKYNGRSITYKEIDERSDRLAEILIEEGIEDEELVGILLESSDYYIVSVLAVLKSGGAFIPIDKTYPKERVEYIFRDSEINLLISSRIYMNDIAFNGKMVDPFIESNYKGSSNIAVVSLNKSIKATNLAYVIYTSGTTGVPKGVMIEHRGVVNLAYWFNWNYNVEKNKNIIQITNISFDVSIEEIFGTLLNGGTLFIPPKSVRLHKVHFKDYINENNINIVQTVPVMLKELLLNNEYMESLKVIICGGEALEEKLKNSIILKGYNLYNHYGPTETTVDATSCKCTLEHKVSIGKPIYNMQCYVICEGERIAGIGEVGELYISGIGMARGYLNNQTLTEEKFVSNVLVDGERAYKTGDLVIYDDKKELIYIGRIDEQIKIRGVRVELKEIESHMISHPEVNEAIALVINGVDGEKKLAVFWKGKASSDDIAKQICKYLPQYITPNYFINVKEFRYTINGKIDKEDLKRYVRIQQVELLEEEENKKNNRVLEILSEAFEKNINILVNSEECRLECLGINSISFVQAVVALEDEFNIEFEDEYLDYRKLNNIKELTLYVNKKILKNS